MDFQAEWYNFVTKSYESFDKAPPDDRLTEFMPQHEAVFGLYRCHLAMGKSPMEAMKEALLAYIGES